MHIKHSLPIQGGSGAANLYTFFSDKGKKIHISVSDMNAAAWGGVGGGRVLEMAVQLLIGMQQTQHLFLWNHKLSLTHVLARHIHIDKSILSTISWQSAAPTSVNNVAYDCITLK